MEKKVTAHKKDKQTNVRKDQIGCRGIAGM